MSGSTSTCSTLGGFRGVSQNPLDILTHLSLALISRRPTCDVVASYNWQCSAICPSGSLAHLGWVTDILTYAQNANRVAQFSPITSKYGSNGLTGVLCHCRWCSHKIFSSLTTSDWMPGTDPVLAINVPICHSVDPGHAGGYDLGISVAYENQAWLGLWMSEIPFPMTWMFIIIIIDILQYLKPLSVKSCICPRKDQPGVMPFPQYELLVLQKSPGFYQIICQYKLTGTGSKLGGGCRKCVHHPPSFFIFAFRICLPRQ